MITVFWNRNGLYVNRILETGTSFNSTYFTEYVLSDIECLPTLHTALQQKKKFVLHTDNSLIHKSPAATENVASLRLVLTSHPSYSSHLAPSEFFLFGYLKKKMVEINLESPQELIDWIRSTFDAIPRHLLDEVFKSWLRRAQDCINSKGTYIKA
jgi:transposase